MIESAFWLLVKGDGFGVAFSHTFAGKLEAVSVIDEALEDSGGVGWVTEHTRAPLFLNGSCLMSRSLSRIIFFSGGGLRC